MSPALPFRTTRSGAARTVGVALALALGLSGCGAGLRAQTYQERTTSDSTNEAIGALAIRHIRVLPPGGDGRYEVGSDARVGFVVVNEGDKADRLVSVTSDAASSVGLVGPTTALEVVPQGTTSGYAFVLRGLTRELRAGQYVQMELTFAENGTETMLVPVEVTGTPGPKRKGYHPAETDSEGNVLVEEEGEEPEGEEPEGEEPEPGAGGTEEGDSDRAELDVDGSDAGSGDAELEQLSDPSGDENGGESAVQPPPEG